MEKPIVTLGAGHGGNDPGSVGTTGIMEKYLTPPLAAHLASALAALGLQPKIVREGDRFLSLSDRGREAARLGARCHVEFHVEPDGGREPEVRVFVPLDTPTDLPAAGAISAAVARALQIRDAGGRTLQNPFRPDSDRLPLLRAARREGVPHVFQLELWMLGAPENEARLQDPAVLGRVAAAAAPPIAALLGVPSPAGRSETDKTAETAAPAPSEAAGPNGSESRTETGPNDPVSARTDSARAESRADGCGCRPESLELRTDTVRPGTWFLRARPSYSSAVVGAVAGGTVLQTSPAPAGFRRVVFAGGIGYLSGGALQPGPQPV